MSETGAGLNKSFDLMSSGKLAVSGGISGRWSSYPL